VGLPSLSYVVVASLAVFSHRGGLVGLQNKDAITSRYANAQAGFTPNCQPIATTGYGVGSFTHSAGTVGTDLP